MSDKVDPVLLTELVNQAQDGKGCPIEEAFKKHELLSREDRLALYKDMVALNKKNLDESKTNTVLEIHDPKTKNGELILHFWASDKAQQGLFWRPKALTTEVRTKSDPSKIIFSHCLDGTDKK